MNKDARIELVIGKSVAGIDVAKNKHDVVINDSHVAHCANRSESRITLMGSNV